MKPRKSKIRALHRLAATVTAYALAAEQSDHTYTAASRRQGVHPEDERTHSVVGSNGRRIIVREDADGLYVGGVLITSHSAVRDLSDLLSGIATGMWARDGRD